LKQFFYTVLVMLLPAEFPLPILPVPGES